MLKMQEIEHIWQGDAVDIRANMWYMHIITRGLQDSVLAGFKIYDLNTKRISRIDWAKNYYLTNIEQILKNT